MAVANCPSCGGQIEFKVGSSAAVICDHCRTVVARTDLSTLRWPAYDGKRQGWRRSDRGKLPSRTFSRATRVYRAKLAEARLADLGDHPPSAGVAHGRSISVIRLNDNHMHRIARDLRA